jgi:hypothetical protein
MSLFPANVFRGFSHLLEAVFNNRSQFERAWHAYQSAANPGQTIQGRWQGEWVSEANGHRGELKCLLSRIGADQLEAVFLARFGGFLRVGYGVRLSATANGEGFRLKGESDLGTLAGGVYQYEGEVGPTEFTCRYRCKYDHGRFDLKRVD